MSALPPRAAKKADIAGNPRRAHKQSLALDLSGLSRESHLSIPSGECDFADAVDEKPRCRAQSAIFYGNDAGYTATRDAKGGQLHSRLRVQFRTAQYTCGQSVLTFVALKQLHYRRQGRLGRVRLRL
jgi:hypothetical protein